MTDPATLTWTYSGDPGASQLDEFRFILQDTNAGLKLLSDQEAQYLIATWMPRYGTLQWCAAAAADVISRRYAGVASVSADGVTVNVSDLSDKYAKIAVRLRAEHEEAAEVEGDVDLANLMVGSELDYGIAPLTFAMGLFDNPEAGEQDYGGVLWYPIVEWAG